MDILSDSGRFQRSVSAQIYPDPKEGAWVARDFRFHNGEVMPELRLHYRTVGEPSGEPVLILHGTTQSGASMLSPGFAGELFGAGQPLDASKYFIVLPDAIAFDPALEPRDERHMKLSRQGQLGALWTKAGLVNVTEAPIVIDQAFTSFDDYWGPFTTGAGPGGAYVVSLSEDRRRQLEDRIRKRLLGDRQYGPFTLKARAWCVRGEVPKA